jgi:hypothetical protein
MLRLKQTLAHCGITFSTHALRWASPIRLDMHTQSRPAPAEAS